MVDRRWFSGRRLLIGIGIAILASVLLVWAWWTAPHRDLAVALDGAQLPAGLLYLGDERQGDRMCFFDNCPRLTRYYGSALEPDELCLVVEEEFPGLDEVNVSPLGRRVCSYWIRGLPGGYGAFLNVRGPAFEIPPENENELIESVPIDVPHKSVLYLTTRR